MERVDVIAWLLAARHDAAIEAMPEYAEALRLMEADPELAGVVDEEKAYYDQHEEYLDFVRIPDGARDRIKGRLRAAAAPPGALITFPWQRLAIAASLVAVLAMGVVTWRQGHAPQIAKAAPITFESFRQFAADQVDNGFDLDYRAADADSVVHWLVEAGAPAKLGPDNRLATLPTMGCKILDWQGHAVSLVCFQVEGQKVHLFVTPASVLPAQELAQGGGQGVYTERETVSWVDNQNAYVLVAHDPGQALNGFSG